MEPFNNILPDGIKLEPKPSHSSLLPAETWGNDELFFTYMWTDETSQFDPKGRWCGGLECYEREYAARVPRALYASHELVDAFVTMMVDNFPEEKGFWVTG